MYSRSSFFNSRRKHGLSQRGGNYTKSLWRNRAGGSALSCILHTEYMNITNIFSSRDLDNISEYVAVILKKNPLKKLFKKTGFNSQTYTIILISFESCGNIGFKMEGRTSFVMGEGPWYRMGLVYKQRGEDTLNPRGVLERKVVGI